MTFFNKYELIYRAHPGTIPIYDINSKVKVISNESIYTWLMVVDLCLSRVSTALFESELFGVPCLRYDPTNYPEKFLTFGLCNYEKITSLDDILKKI